MNSFHKTTYLSEIVEESAKRPVIIYKYSTDCYSCVELLEELEVFVDKNAKEVEVLVFVVVVQEAPVLSKKVEEAFGIKHQSPQIIILNGGKVVHSADRNEIDVSKFELK